MPENGFIVFRVGMDKHQLDDIGFGHGLFVRGPEDGNLRQVVVRLQELARVYERRSIGVQKRDGDPAS